MVLRAAADGWRIAEVDVPYRARAGRSKVTGTVRGTVRAARNARDVAVLAPRTRFARSLARRAAFARCRRGVTPSAVDIYGLALESAAPSLRARRPYGSLERLALERWLGPLTAADETVLDRARAPVLDVGCGPGRHVLALARRGHLALGVDIAPAAVRVARRRGATAIEASVFARIPRAGTWASALLLDGNIGIGGAPEALLARLRQLLRTEGEVLVELAAPGVTGTSEHIRLELGGRHSRPFAWAYVGIDAIEEPARTAGFVVAERWTAERRWFARLVAEPYAAARVPRRAGGCLR